MGGGSSYRMSTTSPLADLLTERGVSQAELARRLGALRSAVNNWLRLGVPAEQVAPICIALDLDPERAARFARDAGRPLPAAVEAHILGAEEAA